MLDNYLIIIEKQENNYSAYCPDVDGCIATGATQDEARKNFLEALEFHFEGLKEDGLPIPTPSSYFASASFLSLLPSLYRLIMSLRCFSSN